jgi:hypothetical protein
MNIERLMEKEEMTPRELNRYLEIGFNVAMAFRPISPYKEISEHLNDLIQNDPLISGYVVSISMLGETN